MKYNKYRVSIYLLVSIMFFNSSCALAGWRDAFGLFGSDEHPNAIAGLTDDEIVQGLKQALNQGSQNAIKKLGKPDGFFGNPTVKIPMPQSLQKAEDILRTLKQDKYADEFILTMNRAAEQAVPEAAMIFTDAIKEMSFKDARKILNGADNAATRYFQDKSSKRLAKKMMPIVRNATNKAGVTARYKVMVDKLGVASSLVDPDALDIDTYITNKSIDGLFKLLADEEKRIRQNPAARTTELLKKVFGA